MSFKTWISAFRLRTLPLAVSAITMGTFMADDYHQSSWSILGLALLTAVSLQILSNLANDYGDFKKGTDNDNRLGDTRALQSGGISAASMLWAIYTFIGISLASGIVLLLEASDYDPDWFTLGYFVVGIAAIAAAIKYTMGKNPYGYQGMGDFFVFIFFGPVAVLGTFLLHTHYVWDPETEWPVLLPTIAIGLFCTAVLNTNNIRDIVNDEASGKYTFPVRVGLERARSYHIVLVFSGSVLMVWFVCYRFHSLLWLSLLFLIPILQQGIRVMKTEPSPEYNKFLKQLSLSVLMLVLSMVVLEAIRKLLLLAGILNIYDNHSRLF